MEKKLLIGIGVLVGIVVLGGISSSNSKASIAGIQIVITPTPSINKLYFNSNTKTQLTPAPTLTFVPTTQPTIQAQVQSSSQNTDSGLNNDNTYINSDGNTVHSPAYSNSIPQGATAQCNDGTYSFSQHRQGTCSYHRGVAQWF